VQAAIAAGAAAAEWLLPQAGATTPAAELLAECAGLLRPEFELRGLRIELACQGRPLPVERSRGRTMICAVLAHVGDQAQGPGAILVELQHRDAACALRFSRRALHAANAADFLRPQQPPMAWEDLLALAQLEAAAVRREADGAIVLELAAARAA
jgi:hypothetical protein